MIHVNTIVLVNDIAESKEFYTNVIGLEILNDWKSMVVFKGMFAIHQANLLQPESVIAKEIKKGKQGSGNIDIYFETNEIEVEYEKMERNGVEIIHGIIELPWQRLFRIKDPDGHIVEIGESKKG